jgi:hypothetical protein
VTNKSEVSSFLSQLKANLLVGRMVYAFRTAKGKNEDTLLKLGIVPRQRDDYVKTLRVEDYFEGPKKDTNGGNDLWVFGKMISSQEIYIKLQLTKSTNVYCISFHIADRPMTYPFKP